MNILKVSVLVSFTLLLTNCKTQTITTINKTLYEQALQGLNNRHFEIQMEEYQDLSIPDNAVEFPLGYIYVYGNEVIVRYSKDFKYSPLIDSSYMKYESSQILNRKTNRKGDLSFDLKVNHETFRYENVFQITLFKNSNKCFVQVKSWDNEKYATIKGVFIGYSDHEKFINK